MVMNISLRMLVSWAAAAGARAGAAPAAVAAAGPPARTCPAPGPLAVPWPCLAVPLPLHLALPSWLLLFTTDLTVPPAAPPARPQHTSKQAEWQRPLVRALQDTLRTSALGPWFFSQIANRRVRVCPAGQPRRPLRRACAQERCRLPLQQN